MDKLSKIPLSVTILIGCVILGVFYFASQVMKQNSIERQQRIELEDKVTQQIIENERQALTIKQNECESLSAGVRAKWNNVMGVTYDDGFWDECVVTYTDTETGEVETSPLRLMQNAE